MKTNLKACFFKGRLVIIDLCKSKLYVITINISCFRIRINNNPISHYEKYRHPHGSYFIKL